MGLLDRIKEIIIRETCVRAINYDKRNLEIRFDTEMAGAKISLVDFQTGIEKIREASEFLELLDNYQYQMCMVCKNLERGAPEWKKYNKIRIGTLHILTSFEATLIAFKSDPEGQEESLNDVIANLQEYLLLIAREVLPHIKYTGESKSTATTVKGSTQILPDTVSKALNIAGLNDEMVDHLVQDLI
jgi:hypothetical protein